MTSMFHPYRRSSNHTKLNRLSATRSTLRHNDGTEDEFFNIQETATSTSKAFLTPDFPKCRLAINPPALPSDSSNNMPTAESSEVPKQETKELAITVFDANDKDKDDENPTSALQYPSNVISLQLSSPRPRASPTANSSEAGLKYIGRSNNQPDAVEPSISTRVSHSIPYDSPMRHIGEAQSGPIKTYQGIPKTIAPRNQSPYASVGSVIAVRTANIEKQQWNISSPGIVIAHHFTDYFVGKKLFSYLVVLGTPVGDITSNFAPYFGEVGGINPRGQSTFPPLVHQDVVSRKEALYTVYARVFLHPRATPNMIWQKARILSRPGEAPIRVRLLHGPLINRIFSAVDLLPYTQESRTAILRGGDEWKKVVMHSQVL